MQIKAHRVIIEKPQYTIRVSDTSPYAEFIIRDGVLYNEKLARETKAALEESAPGKKFHLLVSAEGFFRVTRGTRKLGASVSFSSHLAAVAFYTNNSSLALLGELYNKINKPVVPTRVFSSREAAEEWLFEKLEQSEVA